MPVPTKAYSDGDHSVVVADVTTVCKLRANPSVLLLYLRATPLAPMSFEFTSPAAADAYFVGLVAAMG